MIFDGDVVIGSRIIVFFPHWHWSLTRITALLPLRHILTDKRKSELAEAATNVRAKNGMGETRRLNKSESPDRSLKQFPDTFCKNCALKKYYFLFFCASFCSVRDLAFDFVLTCLFVSQPSLSFTLYPPPPMQTRRQAALNVVLPNPPLTRPATALLSPNDSPHTPRSRALPTKVFSPNSNRKSSDSWNSSIHEDDFSTEWKPEHIRMLQRVRDFLPTSMP
jgi:hypothetical protein